MISMKFGTEFLKKRCGVRVNFMNIVLLTVTVKGINKCTLNFNISLPILTKLAIEDYIVMRFPIVSFVIINIVQNNTLLKGTNYILPLFYTHFIRLGYNSAKQISTKMYRATVRFMKIGAAKATVHLRLQTNFSFFYKHLFSDLALFRYETSEHNAVLRLKIS
jgi:hypothetical protein